MLPIVRKIVDYMSSNLERELTLNDFSRYAELSPSRMRDLFRAQMGISPGRYLKVLRMEKARELLETTALSVGQIRARVGMQDHSHFARDFKKTFGVPPSKYRAKAIDPEISSKMIKANK
ncbi:MAG: helix-turn-helix domain-containing protein [Blastocatellia bacterium]